MLSLTVQGAHRPTKMRRDSLGQLCETLGHKDGCNAIVDARLIAVQHRERISRCPRMSGNPPRYNTLVDAESGRGLGDRVA
jgi:hypothetical protein